MVRKGKDAIAWARNRSFFPSGMCQQFVRLAFGCPAGAPSAAAAWRSSNKKHRVSPDSVPAGAPIYWTGGSHGFGHTAVGLGHGLCESTDWPSRGRVSTARIADITRSWRLHWEGWSGEINGVDCYDSPQAARTAPRPKIDVSNAAKAARGQQPIYWGQYLKRAVAAEVGKGDMDLRTKRLGSSFRDQYRKVQREYLAAQGIKNPAKDAVDGIPGGGSMDWLAKRHGFQAV